MEGKIKPSSPRYPGLPNLDRLHGHNCKEGWPTLAKRLEKQRGNY